MSSSSCSRSSGAGRCSCSGVLRVFEFVVLDRVVGFRMTGGGALGYEISTSN